jgi:hypothetical protein
LAKHPEWLMGPAKAPKPQSSTLDNSKSWR